MLAFVAVALAETVAQAFPPPEGARRVAADDFGASLRELPLRPEGTPVRLYDGRVSWLDAARVVDLPMVPGDLQQCADSALRLRATWERERGGDPAFHYTSGDVSRWSSWAKGTRPRVRGRDVSFVAGAARPDASDAAFEAYLADLFTYAGTRSLPLDTVAADDPLPGDLLVTPGSPGHAVVVLDVATDGARTWVLVGQGFLPAVSFHVLDGPDGGWFPVEGDTLPSQPIAMPWSGLRRWR